MGPLERSLLGRFPGTRPRVRRLPRLVPNQPLERPALPSSSRASSWSSVSTSPSFSAFPSFLRAPFGMFTSSVPSPSSSCKRVRLSGSSSVAPARPLAPTRVSAVRTQSSLPSGALRSSYATSSSLSSALTSFVSSWARSPRSIGAPFLRRVVSSPSALSSGLLSLLHSVPASSLRLFSSLSAANSSGRPSPAPKPAALYVAKEANVYTVEELQRVIMQSPSFSPDRDPLLLENFFSTVEDDPSGTAASVEDEDGVESAERMLKELGGFEQKEEEGETSERKEAEDSGEASLISGAIVRAFNPARMKVFTHGGWEWLWQAEGTGTRKRAAAHVIIRRGTGQVRVNNDEDLYVRWPFYYNRMDVMQPFYLTGTAGVYDLFIHTRGGGSSGQAGAVRLALGRALVNACPQCAKLLEEDMVLYEDTRQRMPKMPGRMKARKMRTWTKR
ncbi:putative ribosomal protein S9 [Besnoitia besnoiti]|uniref:Putative ribosomal protein S9 n=1 Tax=Besnoitia besnoiti TaxID=94643 RepID=A0A2A9M7Y8_BESBE|nr:putative ribosomal protein S9 [Besnoitia besnoiti]PFH31767.1 putative ribosomal protein S9 [Besnoitia besnoiti]